MKIAVFAVVALLTGCVTASEIVPAGKDSYMISASAMGGLNSGKGIIEATKTANAYCAKSGKFIVIRHSETGGNAGFGGEHSNLIFTCVNENDPEYGRPNLRKDNGVSTIENR